MVVQTLNALLMQVAVFAKATSSARTIFNIIDHEPEIALEADGRHTPESLEGIITLRNIDFRYPTRPAAQVLHNLSLNFPAGKVTALVGPSGSGKSTIVGLIERWYDPEQGTVYLDGVDIKSLNLRWLRQQIGIVQQVRTQNSRTRGTLLNRRQSNSHDVSIYRNRSYSMIQCLIMSPTV